MNLNDLNNKVAIVTGGNSGIGFSTAKKLKEHGAKVIITGRSQEKVSAAASELGVIGYTANAKSLQDLNGQVEFVKNKFGKVDILFNNAGIFAPAPIGQIPEEMFDHQKGINFKGAVFTDDKLLEVMNDGASKINLSSVNAYNGKPNTAIYGASKAA